MRRVCLCGCQRSLEGRRANTRYFDGACRVRALRARRSVIRPGRSLGSHRCNGYRGSRDAEGGRVSVRVIETERRAFFTPTRLALYLALSERTVRSMLAAGKIASYKVEGARRIDP